MFETHDYLVNGLLWLAASAQLVPAYFGFRVYKFGYARYWSEGWLVFIFLCLWIMLRRSIAAASYDPDCPLPPSWVFDNLISTIVTSGLLTLFASLKYRFFAVWFELKPIPEAQEKK